MAIQTINIGNRVNDGLGDDLRTAFEKVNANFTELGAQLSVTGRNLGEAGAGVYKDNDGGVLQFRNLASGTKIQLEELDNSIIINSTQPDAFTRFDTDSGNVRADIHQQITLQGQQASGSYKNTKDIEVTTNGSSVLFKTIIPVTEILQTYDFGPINGDFTDTTQLSLAAANVDFGTIQLPSRVDLDLGTLS